MAAHPFGPLQASLLVGYYKRVRHFDPSLAKPEFVPLCERFLPNAKSDSLFALVNPRFDSTALANGNNFNKSVKVAVNFESGCQVNLLSRGLGYRITFTMAAPLPTEPSTEFGLHVHVDILDFLGKETITTLEWDPDPDVLEAVLDNFQEDNVKELGKFNSLVIEVTGDKLKIVQNLKSEIIIDTVCPTRSQPTSAKSSALKGLNVLLGDMHAKGIQVNETTIPLIAQKVLGILNFMVMNPQNATKETKSTFKDYLIHGTSVITQLVSALKTIDEEARGNFAKLDPHIDHLARDVRGWLEADQQPFPAYLTLPYLRKLESVFDYFEDGDVLAKSFLIKNVSKLIQKTDIAFFKTVPHFGLFEFQSLLASIIVESTWYEQLQQTYNPDSGYLTIHFVIKDSRPQVKVIPRGPNSTETFFISRCPKMAKVSDIDDFFVVPEKD